MMNKRIENIIKIRRQVAAYRLFGNLDRWWEISYYQTKLDVLKDIRRAME